MKKILVSIFLLCLVANAYALEFRPNTVKSMDVNVTIVANGTFSGSLHEKDKMEVKTLTLRNTETQQIFGIEEKLMIGGNEYFPTYETQGNNKWAVFKIDDLRKYAETPNFTVEIKARVKTDAQFELGDDVSIEGAALNYSEYLESTKYIEANDPELVAKARLEFQSESALETVREIAEWVHKNINYDFENYYDGIWSAKHTYEKKAGVCDEFANLTAAFMRIKGIPVKYIAGVSFDGKRFGNHGWNEVFVNGKWIGVDSTYGEAGYLDAAHIVLAEGKDASELSNLSATVWSIEPLKLETTLEDPEIAINGIEFFENLVDVEIEKPTELKLGEEFSAIVKLTNRRPNNLIIPVKFMFHEEFAAANESKLVWLKPNESQELEWKAVAPQTGTPGFYVEYDMALFLPDQNRVEKIRVYPVEAKMENVPNIELLDISPIVENGNLKLELNVFNKGLAAGSIKISIKYDNDEKTFEETLDKFSKKKLVYELLGVGPGKVSVEITGDLEKSFEIEIPEKVVEQKEVEAVVTEKKPVVEKPGEAEQVEAAEEVSFEKLLENEGLLLSTLGILVVALFVLVFKLLSK